MFTVTIVLMWAEVSGPQLAMIIGASILAIRRLSEMILPRFQACFRSLRKWFAIGRDVGPLCSRFLPCRIWGTFNRLCSACCLQGSVGYFVPYRGLKTLPGAEDILSDEKPDMAGYRGSNGTFFNRSAVSRLQP